MVKIDAAHLFKTKIAFIECNQNIFVSTILNVDRKWTTKM